MLTLTVALASSFLRVASRGFRTRSGGSLVASAAALAIGAGVSVGAASALARTGVTESGSGSGSSESVLSGSPERETIMRLARPVTIEFKESRLEDVVKFITELTGANIEALWIDDRNSVGLNKDQIITYNARNISALKLLEQVLQRADESGDVLANTWQMSDGGAMQIGPKERLNSFKRVQIYDINDLLFIIPEYTEAPEFDLQSVLQSSGQGGGGGGQSPFRDNQQDQNRDTVPRSERAREIITLLTELIEPDQWVDNGGTGGTIRYFQGGIIVNAPDYMHRQIDGYPYMPTTTRSVSTVNGRRWVTLNLDTAASQLDQLANQPVTPPLPGPR